MVMCWAPGCKHYSVRELCKFFKFPTSEPLRKDWMKLLRRDVPPGPSAAVCSCHFKDGNKENRPTLFVHNESKRFEFEEPENKKRRGRTVLADASNVTPKPSTSTAVEETLSDALTTDDEATIQTQQTIAEPKQTDSSGSRSQVELEAENYFLKEELSQAKKKIGHLSVQFSYLYICDHDNLILLYTGIPNNCIFKSLLNLLKDVKVNYYQSWNVQKMSREDQILLTLMKLRQNFPQDDIAVRFNVSQSTVSNVTTTWIAVLHEVLFKTLMKTIPPRANNKLCLPNAFSVFTNCRIILDCTEIYTSVPRSSMTKQKSTYSSYKHRNTWKGLVGVAPNGVVTYISDLYPGSTSDKKIVKDCGIISQLVAGDLVLADKGFLIRDCLPPGVELNIPPFLLTSQFTPQQVYQTEAIASARIHVERAIRRMKSFKILNFIPHTLLQQADMVFQVVGALTNLQYPLIKEVEQYY